MSATDKYTICHYQDKYHLSVVSIFYSSIQQLAKQYYTQPMLDKWSESAFNIDYWRKRLAFIKPFLAFHGETLVGFVELEEDGHIGCLYTHPDWARQGVATFLWL